MRAYLQCNHVDRVSEKCTFFCNMRCWRVSGELALSCYALLHPLKGHLGSLGSPK